MKPVTLQATPRPDNRFLDRLVLGLGIALILVVVGFAAYYYLDRYSVVGSKSPTAQNIQHLEEQVRKNPQDPDLRVALAQYYAESNMFAKALEQTQQVLRSFPDKQEVLFLAGMAYARSEQPQAAIEPLEKLAAFRRGSEMAQADTILEATLYYLGESYIKLHQAAKAIPILAEALIIDRTDADALYQLGLAYALDGQHQQAVEQLQRAVIFVPDLTEAYEQMAKSYVILSLPDQAAYARGMEAYSKKNYSQARDQLTQVVSRLPDFLPAQLGLGLTLERLGERQLAANAYQQVLALEPDNMLATRGLDRVGSPDAIHPVNQR